LFQFRQDPVIPDYRVFCFGLSPSQNDIQADGEEDKTDAGGDSGDHFFIGTVGLEHFRVKSYHAAGSKNRCRSRLHLDANHPPRCNLGLQLLEHYSKML